MFFLKKKKKKNIYIYIYICIYLFIYLFGCMGLSYSMAGSFVAWAQ